MSFLNLTNVFHLVYDNEDGGDGKGGDGGDGKGGDGGDGKGGDGKLSFTQDQLNKMMADNRRKLTQQNETLLGELNGIKEQANLTAQAKTELEDRIEELQSQFLSKEELAKRKVTKATKDHEDLVAKITQDGKNWQQLYTNERVTTALTKAAIAAKATVPAQIVSLLGSQTHLSPQLGEDGQPNGLFDTMVKFNDVGEDGKPVVLDLAPEAALKRMQELPDQFGNLFINPGAGGMGGDSGSGAGKGKQVSVDQLKDTDAYMAWRKKNPGVDPTQFTG